MSKFFLIIFIGGLATLGSVLAQEPYGTGPRPFYLPPGAGRDGGGARPTGPGRPYYPRIPYKPPTSPIKPNIAPKPKPALGRALGVALGYVAGCEALYFQYFSVNNSIDSLCTQLFSCRQLVEIGRKSGRGGMEFIKKHCKAIDSQIIEAKRKAGALKGSFSICFTAGWQLPEINKCQY